jgi:predicted HTH transcriptional regulator
MEKSIRKLIQDGENNQVEFKKTISSLHKIAKTISSMANSLGGSLFIGVNDQGLLVGAEVSEERYMIEEACSFYIKPAIEVEFQEYTDSTDKTILLVKVPNSEQKPHACLSTENEWQYYIRNHDQSVKASPLVVKTLQKSEIEQEVVLSEKETILHNYLRKRNKITLLQCASLLKASKRNARRILIEGVKNGQLYEHTYESTVFYTLVN